MCKSKEQPHLPPVGVCHAVPALASHLPIFPFNTFITSHSCVCPAISAACQARPAALRGGLRHLDRELGSKPIFGFLSTQSRSEGRAPACAGASCGRDPSDPSETPQIPQRHTQIPQRHSQIPQRSLIAPHREMAI